MLVEESNGSTDASLRFRPGTDSTSRKWCFPTLFFKLAKRVFPKSFTTGQIEPMRCPIGRSTEISPQLAVSVRYEALKLAKIQGFMIFVP